MALPTGNANAAGSNAPLPPGVNSGSLLTGSGGPGAGLTGGNQPIAPGAAVSPYEISLVENAKVIIGSWMANMLGISGSSNTPVLGSTVMQAYQDLPLAKQEAVMVYLYNAGFYLDANGAKPAQFDFNASDAANTNAMTFALLNTYNKNLNASPSGTTLSSLVASQIASGAGAQELQTAPSPVLGGGNTYQVALTAPDDLYNTLYSTWESELGYAPNQKTLDKFVNVFQSEQAKYQQALNAQQENASFSKFRQQEAARNTELGFANTPHVAQGAVPTGPFHTPAAWATAFVRWASMPVTGSNVAFIVGMINKLGTWGSYTKNWNPLAVQTPYPAPGQVEKGTPNPNAPATYSNNAQGMQAVLDELTKYPALYALLQSGNASSAKLQNGTEVAGELAQWTSGKIKTTLTPSKADTEAANHATAIYSRITSAQQANQKLAQSGPPGDTVIGTGQGQGQSNAQAVQIAKEALAGKVNLKAGPEQPATTPTATPPNPTAPNATTTTTTPAAPPPPPTTPTATPPTTQPQQPAKEPTIQEAKAKAKQQMQQAKGGPAPGQRVVHGPQPAQVPNAPIIPTTPAANLTGGQNQYSTGDTYLGQNTLVGTEPPSAQGLAFTEATTGANAVPFQGNEYLQAFDTIADMIASGKVNG